jgi:hypothetical protein
MDSHSLIKFSILKNTQLAANNTLKKSLLLIPDIIGLTKFVNETEIVHDSPFISTPLGREEGRSVRKKHTPSPSQEWNTRTVDGLKNAGAKHYHQLLSLKLNPPLAQQALI